MVYSFLCNFYIDDVINCDDALTFQGPKFITFVALWMSSCGRVRTSAICRLYSTLSVVFAPVAGSRVVLLHCKFTVVGKRKEIYDW